MQVPLQLYDLNGAGYRTVWRDAAPRLPSRVLAWTPRVWLQRPRGHFYGAPRLMPITSSRGKGATPLPARLSLILARAQCIWVPQTSFYSAGTEERREGRCASSRRAKPGSGRGPANVGAQAIIQSCWSGCRAAEGRDAAPRSPAQAGPHVSGCRGHHAIRLEPSGGGEGATPPPPPLHGPSPGLDLGPQLQMLRSSYLLVAAKQLRWGALCLSPPG